MPFFDLGSMELLLISVVALIVVGPKDLPKLMRTAGRMMGKLRGTARHFKSGIDEMIRQSELEEMQEKWNKHNQDIMTGPPIPASGLGETYDEDTSEGDNSPQSNISPAAEKTADELPIAASDTQPLSANDGDNRNPSKP